MDWPSRSRGQHDKGLGVTSAVEPRLKKCELLVGPLSTTTTTWMLCYVVRARPCRRYGNVWRSQHSRGGERRRKRKDRLYAYMVHGTFKFFFLFFGGVYMKLRWNFIRSKLQHTATRSSVLEIYQTSGCFSSPFLLLCHPFALQLIIRARRGILNSLFFGCEGKSNNVVWHIDFHRSQPASADTDPPRHRLLFIQESPARFSFLRIDPMHRLAAAAAFSFSQEHEALTLFQVFLVSCWNKSLAHRVFLYFDVWKINKQTNF